MLICYACSSLAEQAAAQKATQTEKAKKKTVVTLIDPKRSQNAAIALARLKFTFEDIREKISSMDESAFTPDQLKNLEEFLPTAKEIRDLKAYKGDITELGKAEQYMYAMMGLPGAAKRMQCLVYKHSFKTRVFDLKETMSKLEGACDDVRTSAKFKKVLKTILKVGNALNDDADQVAFSIASLPTLSAAKAFDNKTSILAYVVMLIQKNDPVCLLFPDELSHTTAASRFPMELVTSEVSLLRKGLETCKRAIASIDAELSSAIGGLATLAATSSDCDGEEEEQEVEEEEEEEENRAGFAQFLINASSTTAELEQSSKSLVEKYSSLLEYFGEDSGLKCQDFFAVLSRFAAEFSTARDNIERQRKQEERREKAKLESEKRASTKAAKLAAAARAEVDNKNLTEMNLVTPTPTETAPTNAESTES